MAKTAKQIRELAERIEALPPKDRVKLLDEVLTPAMRMRLLADQVRRRTAIRDERQIDRAVNRAVQRARRAVEHR